VPPSGPGLGARADGRTGKAGGSVGIGSGSRSPAGGRWTSGQSPGGSDSSWRESFGSLSCWLQLHDLPQVATPAPGLPTPSRGRPTSRRPGQARRQRRTATQRGAGALPEAQPGRPHEPSHRPRGRGPGGKPPDPPPLNAASRFPRQPLAAIDGSLVWATSVTPFSGVTWLRERRITVTASTTSHTR
jgi:hypothetical protein